MPTTCGPTGIRGIKRSRLYTIREGFFDIWLAMNLSRGARRRLPFLLDFFSLLYPSIAAREEKRRQLRAKLLEEGSADAGKGPRLPERGR